MRVTVTATFTGAATDRFVRIQRSGADTIILAPDAPSAEVDADGATPFHFYEGGLVVEPDEPSEEEHS